MPGPLLFSMGRFYGAGRSVRHRGEFDALAMDATATEDQVAIHTHEDAHFVLVLAGGYISSARDAPGLAAPPFLVFNPPGTTHRDRFLGGRGRFLALSLPMETLACVREAQPVGEAARRLVSPLALRAATQIAREIQGVADPDVIDAAGWDLAARLAPASPAGRLGDKPAWLARAYQMIMDAGLGRLSVREVAAACEVHPTHLARAFRDLCGWSPAELIRRRRLELAADLLAGTSTPLAELAAAAGFADQAHLTHVFRRAFGATPGAFRRGRDVAGLQDAAWRSA